MYNIHYIYRSQRLSAPGRPPRCSNNSHIQGAYPRFRRWRHLEAQLWRQGAHLAASAARSPSWLTSLSFVEILSHIGCGRRLWSALEAEAGRLRPPHPSPLASESASPSKSHLRQHRRTMRCCQEGLKASEKMSKKIKKGSRSRISRSPKAEFQA